MDEQSRLRSQGAGQIALGRMTAEQNILQGDKAFDLQSQQLGASGVGMAGAILQGQQQFPMSIAAGAHEGSANRALQLAIAQGNASASRDASQYQMYGTALGFAGMGMFG